MKKMPLDDSVRAVITDGRVRMLENCVDLIDEAAASFAKERFARSCFLAMTGIEEAGKLAVLRFFSPVSAQRFSLDLQGLDRAGVSNLFRNHPEEAREAAASSFAINAGADRRHGVHPASGIHRTSGLILLVRSGQWMSTRNACLYVDPQFCPTQLTFPRGPVSKALAFYMICMAYEVVAEQGANAIEDADTMFNFQQQQIATLIEFMRVWAVSSDLDALPFLSEPDRFRHAATEREKRGTKTME